jgi:acetylornithine deacetylase
MVSAHSDVVPVDGQSWTSDPFVLTPRDGRFHGRGACDMKGFLAVALASVPSFAGADLHWPLHVAVTYDEEVGCLGVPVLIEALRGLPVRPRMVIVGEPTAMRVAVGHKGARAYQARFRGRAAHSSLAPAAVNAVEHAAELVTRLTRLGREYAAAGPFADGYDVAHTTVHTGVVHGGTQVNIVPDECAVHFEFRPLPGLDADAVEGRIRTWLDDDIGPAMAAIDDACGVELEREYAYPGLDTPVDAPIVALARSLGAGEPVRIAFGAEAGAFHAGLDAPSIVCGPGSIRQAHQADEYVSAAQLASCEDFFDKLRTFLESPPVGG